MISMRLFVVAATLTALLSIPAQAHFLFVRILPPAEGGRAAEVYFSELAEAGDSRFVDKIAHTQLWLQSTPGKFTPLKVLKAPDRLHLQFPDGEQLRNVVFNAKHADVAPSAHPLTLENARERRIWPRSNCAGPVPSSCHAASTADRMLAGIASAPRCSRTRPPRAPIVPS